MLKNYNVWQRDLKNRNQDQVDYTTKLKSLESELKAKKEEKDKIDTSSANSFLIKTRNRTIFSSLSILMLSLEQ